MKFNIPWIAERRKQSEPFTFRSSILIQFKIISTSFKSTKRPGSFVCRLIPITGVVRINDFTTRKMTVHRRSKTVNIYFKILISTFIQLPRLNNRWVPRVFRGFPLPFTNSNKNFTLKFEHFLIRCLSVMS